MGCLFQMFMCTLHTNQTGPYFWVEDREKAVHVHIFTDELGKKNKFRHIHVWGDKAAVKFVSPYFCHLHNVGKVCQTGDGDHIVVGFQFVPGEVRTRMKIYNVKNRFSEPISWEGDDLTQMILRTSPPWSGCSWLPPAPPTHCPKYSICYSTVGTTVDTLSSFTAPVITPVLGRCVYSVNNEHFGTKNEQTHR